jgi:hypothetical protein
LRDVGDEVHSTPNFVIDLKEMFIDERTTDFKIKGFKIHGDKLFVYSKTHIANYDINRVNRKSKKELEKEKKKL